MDGWAIDLGNSNTRVARWDPESGAPKLLELPGICREPGGTEPLSAPRLIPSATEIIADPSWVARLSRRPFFAKRLLLGDLATIGRPALENNIDEMRPGFVPAFKPYLDRESTRTLTRVGRRSYSARDVARLFVRELLAEIKTTTGVRVRDLVLTTPVEAFETYRAELSGIARSLGVRKLRFIDEPVAAALGYGLSLGRERLILVVDFGAGTLDLALVSFSAKEAEGGTARVIAKRGDSLGGKHVDQWLLGDFSKTMGYDLGRDDRDEDGRLWRQFMLAEARRVKETLFFQPTSIFQLTPPDHMRSLCSEGLRADDPWMEVTR
ncbi:MAG: Hsp70 family protein, partial [Verrucomicrobiota bacterium]